MNRAINRREIKTRETKKMNTKTFSKIAVTILFAFFAGGGACNPPTRTVTSENINAADVFTLYRIVKHNSSADGKCTRRVTTQFSGDNKIYLQPPAQATYNGAEIGDSSSGGSFSEFDCQTDRAEFVLTDNQGGTKREVYELKKAKFDFPAAADRVSDSMPSADVMRVYGKPIEERMRYNPKLDKDYEFITYPYVAFGFTGNRLVYISNEKIWGNKK